MAPSRAMWAAGPICVFLLLLRFETASASHFRYGSIKWTPTQVTNQAEFELQVAYRKNYNWGAFYKEKWRDTAVSNVWSSDLGLSQTLLPCDSTDLTLTNANILCFDDTTAPYTTSYELLFPAGMGINGNDLVPNTDGQDAFVYPANSAPGDVGKIANSVADAENTGGKVCKCRFHKGVNALDVDCPETTTNIGGGLQTELDGSNNPITGYPYTSNDPKHPILDPQFYLGFIDPTASNVAPFINGEIKECTPWSEVFGFFYGDGDFNTEGVVVRVTELDFDNTVLGNSFRGTSTKFTHTYPSGYSSGVIPYIAYFTGGNRLKTLNNNPQGRFRLETAVKFNPATPNNASPVGGALPLLPLPYTNTPGVQFQIPAYDRDEGDEVRFFLANQVEQGGLLLNPSLNGIPSWHKDVYIANICREYTGPADVFNCKSNGLSGLSQAETAAYETNTLYLANVAAGNTMPTWTESIHLPHQPSDLTIDYLTGVVTWKVGIDMETADSAGFGPKSTGFYNLVVMVEERKQGETDVPETRDPLAVKIPIDFLLYLYPTMHYCNKDCDNRGGGNILQTFESRDGLYGDSQVGGTYPLSGNGQCKICGGGGAYLNPTGVPGAVAGVSGEDDEVVYDVLAYNNGTFYCDVEQQRTNHIYPDGSAFATDSSNAAATSVEWGFVSDPAWDYTFPAGYDFQGCLGAGPEDASSIVPYHGEYDVCNTNSPPFFITADTTPQGETPRLLFTDPQTGLQRAKVSKELGQPVEFTLQAYDPDQCSEVAIGDVGLSFNMDLSSPSRVDSLGADDAPKSVQRTFTWPAYYFDQSTGEKIDTTNAGLDQRDQFSVVCFYTSDKYLLTVHPFHCVEITLVQPTTIEWCNTEPENGRLYDTSIGVEKCISMCVKKSPIDVFQYHVTVRPVPLHLAGQYPLNNVGGTEVFSYPYDTINFPANGYFKQVQDPLALQDPFNVDYCLSPSVEEECVFTMCFEGLDLDTIEGDLYEGTEVRCYIFQVYNYMLLFMPEMVVSGTGAIVPTDNIWVHDDEVSSKLDPKEGYSASAWVKPQCAYSSTTYSKTAPLNRTVFLFASTRSNTESFGPGVDDGLEVRAAVMWNEASDTTGSFYYYDCHGGAHFTGVVECNTWHYVALSVAEGGSGHLYVDGALNGYDVTSSIDPHKAPGVAFHTSSRPDNYAEYDNDTGAMVPGSNGGYFRVGGGFYGSIDEVRVWKRELSAADVDEDMFARQATTGGNGPVLVMSFSDSTQIQWNNPTSAIPPVPNKDAYPGMIPCVLGVDTVIGPATGGCMVDVRVWQVAPSTQLTCQFGDMQTRAVYQTQNWIQCETPASPSPQFVAVRASNNGGRFSNVTAVGKEVQYLYMDSVLFLSGDDWSGANIDGVCSELVAKQVADDDKRVTFGGWFCPDCNP